MTELLIALCVVFLVVMGGRAHAAWPSYRGTVYQQLFGSFLEYFWKYSINQDLSQSGYLASELGTHRLLYNAYRDAGGNEACQFVTVISTRGVASICAVHTAGKVSGSDKGVWHVERDGAAHTLPSPLVYVHRQQKFMGKALGMTKPAQVIVFDDGAELSGVKCELPVINASELVAFLKGLETNETLSEQGVIEMFNAIKTHMTRK